VRLRRLPPSPLAESVRVTERFRLPVRVYDYGLCLTTECPYSPPELQCAPHRADFFARHPFFMKPSPAPRVLTDKLVHFLLPDMPIVIWRLNA
jgi:hypothetical protein